ncbi:MAG: sodium-dependent transporter [Myxococcota bacterium]
MAAPTPGERGAFGSRLGFVFAAAGSAIGLGNIWRFPYAAGENGGGAFVLVYLICVALIGVPVLLAELSVGRAGQRNPVGAFKALVPSRFWPLVGGLGVLTGFGILSFYSVVAGWTVGYLYRALTGQFLGGLSPEQSKAAFEELIADPVRAMVLTASFLLLTILVVRGGVHKGIERATKVLMPVFFALLLFLAGRSVTLPGAEKGIDFLLQADFSRLGPRALLDALGQALFSLSLGMGAMITYGSYLGRDENLPSAGLTVAFFDTLIALLAGFMIFPALFATGMDPAQGAGLVFVVLPTIFDQLPGGLYFAIAFYALLMIAALTSTISLLEVVVAYFADEKGWAREKAVWVVGLGSFVLAVPSALSVGAVDVLGSLLGRWSFLDLQDMIFGNFALSVGAFFIALFVGWKWGTGPALAEMSAGGHHLPAPGLWAQLVRYLCPVAVAAVFGFLIWTYATG